MPAQYIAVIDIGKTNKKVIIFDDSLQIVDSAYQSFEEYVEGAIHFENIGPMTEWFKAQLKIFSAKYSIQALSITTHGATAICIDKQGDLAVPPVAYTTEAGEEFREDFIATFGSIKDLQQQTATAEIGSLINLGKKIHFLKKTYPEKFRNVHMILNYPQYFGFVFTGMTGAEPTYVGCHTYLYDFNKRKYSGVAEKLDIIDKLPSPISKSWEILGTVKPGIARETGLPSGCIVTMGIHDSNSSLLPYLVKGYRNFVLNSTGTWCVAMHPTDTVSFEPQELGKLVFFNLDAFFNPVKTSIFMGGLEFETYSRILQKINNKSYYPEFSAAVYEKILREKNLFILPSVVKGTGLFPDAIPRVIEGTNVFILSEIEQGTRIPQFFSDYETAFAALNLSLAIQTRIALSMAGYGGGGSIFTEGGFRKNTSYNALLAALHANSNVSLSRLDEATAFGAAILGKAALDKSTPEETRDLFDIEIIPVVAPPLDGLEDYVAAFERLMATGETLI